MASSAKMVRANKNVEAPKNASTDHIMKYKCKIIDALVIESFLKDNDRHSQSIQLILQDLNNKQNKFTGFFTIDDFEKIGITLSSLGLIKMTEFLLNYGEPVSIVVPAGIFKITIDMLTLVPDEDFDFDEDTKILQNENLLPPPVENPITIKQEVINLANPTENTFSKTVKAIKFGRRK